MPLSNKSLIKYLNQKFLLLVIAHEVSQISISKSAFKLWVFFSVNILIAKIAAFFPRGERGNILL